MSQSSSCGGCLLKGIAGFFVFLFVSIALFIMVNLAVDLRLLRADLYKSALAGSGLYDRAPELIAEQINTTSQNTTGGSQGEGNVLGNQLWAAIPPAERVAFLTAVLPKSWLQGQVDNFLDQIFGYLNGEDVPLPPRISLVEFKNNLLGPAGLAAFDRLLQNLPACTPEQAAAWQSQNSGNSANGKLTYCKLPGMDTNEFARMAQGYLARSLSQMQDEIVLGTQTEFIQAFGEIQRVLSIFRTVLYLSPIILIILLGVITLLAVRSISSFLRWWGATFLLTGGLGTVTFIAALLLTGSLVSALMSKMEAAPGLLEIIQNIFSSVFSGATTVLAIGSGLFLFAGLGMLVFSLFFRSQPPLTPVMVAPPNYQDPFTPPPPGGGYPQI